MGKSLKEYLTEIQEKILRKLPVEIPKRIIQEINNEKPEEINERIPEYIQEEFVNNRRSLGRMDPLEINDGKLERILGKIS